MENRRIDNRERPPYHVFEQLSIARLAEQYGTEELERYRIGLEFRATIDGFAARHAARRVAQKTRSGTDTQPLLEAFSCLRQINLLTDSEKFADADIRLHREILLLSNIPGIIAAWTPVLQEVDRFRTDTLKVCWPDSESLVEAHRVIVDAICQGREDLSEELAKRHLEPVWLRMAQVSNYKPVYEDPLERVCVYIQFHYHENLTLQWLSENIAELSSGHLTRLFRLKCRKSFTDYLREIRLEKAAELLRSATFSIGTIAHLVGYDDLSRFSQHFRQFFGVPPMKYRIVNSERRKR